MAQEVLQAFPAWLAFRDELLQARPGLEIAQQLLVSLPHADELLVPAKRLQVLDRAGGWALRQWRRTAGFRCKVYKALQRQRDGGRLFPGFAGEAHPRDHAAHLDALRGRRRRHALTVEVDRADLRLYDLLDGKGLSVARSPHEAAADQDQQGTVDRILRPAIAVAREAFADLLPALTGAADELPYLGADRMFLGVAVVADRRQCVRRAL